MKTVVITNDNLNSMLSLADFVHEFGADVSAIVVTTRLPGQKSNVVGVLRMLRGSGVAYTYFKVLTNVLLPARLRIRGRPASLSALMHHLGFDPEVIVCESANDPVVVASIERHAPEIVLAAGATHIFGGHLIEVASVATVNLHPSVLPAYAGVSPQFWCLCQGDARTGGTLHVIVPKLDAGPIIDQRTFEIEERTTVLGIILKTTAINNAMLTKLYRAAPDALLSARPQDLAHRSYRRHPKRKDIRAFRSRGRRFASRADIHAVLELVDRCVAGGS